MDRERKSLAPVFGLAPKTIPWLTYAGHQFGHLGPGEVIFIQAIVTSEKGALGSKPAAGGRASPRIEAVHVDIFHSPFAFAGRNQLSQFVLILFSAKAYPAMTLLRAAIGDFGLLVGWLFLRSCRQLFIITGEALFRNIPSDEIVEDVVLEKLKALSQPGFSGARILSVARRSFGH